MPDGDPKKQRAGARRTRGTERSSTPITDSGSSARAQGFLQRIVGFFAGRDDAARLRKKLLREYARRVNRSRPRLFNSRTSTAEPALGALFHSFYRVLGPARILLRNASLSSVLKTVTVERSLTEKQRELLAALSEEGLTTVAQGQEPGPFVEGVREDLKAVMRSFDKKTVQRARRAYRSVLVLVDLVNYDYWSVLRRMDPRYPEADFTYVPRFLPVDASYVADSLKDFLEVLDPVEGGLDWAEALGILRDFRGMELVSPEAWRQLLRSIADLKRSGLLLAIVRLIDGDPSYEPISRPPEGKLVETYVANVRKQTETIVRRILEAKRQKAISGLTRDVFGDAKLPPLTNYTDAWNDLLTRKALGSLSHVPPLALTKAYLIELHKTKVKDVVDALLIRGKWRDVGLSRSLSDAFQDTLGVLADVLEFDRNLGENQELGLKLKAAISRADKSKPQSLRTAHQIIEHIERLATACITRTAQGCVALGQLLRALVEDAGQANPQILMNWRELKGGKPEEDLRAQIVGVYRRLQSFVQLLKLTMAKSATAARASAAPAAAGAPAAAAAKQAAPAVPEEAPQQ